MLAREGSENWTDKIAANDYIRTQLGRKEGQTFLTELSLVPASDGADKRWMQLFEQIDPQLSSKIKERKEKLKQFVKDGRPWLIICYGHTRADDFAELLGIKWERQNEKILKSPDSKCLLLPFFGQGRMSHPIIDDMLQRKLLA